MPILYPGNKSRYIVGLLKDFIKPAKRAVDPFAGSAVIPTRLMKAGKISEAVIGDTSPEMLNIYRQLKYNESETLDNLQRILNMLSRGSKKATVSEQDIALLRDFRNKRAGGFAGESESAAIDITIGNYASRYNPSIPSDVLFTTKLDPSKVKNKESIINNVRDTAQMLRQSKIVEGGYEQTLKEVKKGDFLVIDPPYINTRGYSKEYKLKSSVDYDAMSAHIRELSKKTSGVMYNTEPIREYFPKMDFKRTNMLHSVPEVEARWGDVWQK